MIMYMPYQMKITCRSNQIQPTFQNIYEQFSIIIISKAKVFISINIKRHHELFQVHRGKKYGFK